MNQCNQLQEQLTANSVSNNNSNKNTPKEQQENVEFFKVSTKVPPFYTDKPDLWFHQVEAQFRNNKITCDQTKYDVVVSSLDPKYLDVVAHIIRDPPALNKYDVFKSTLVTEYQHSDEKRLMQLLQGIDLGDRKPSALLRQMREISKGIVTDKILETLWSHKLPETVRAIIVSINITLDEKAQTADKILDTANFETAATSQISADTRINNNTTQTSDLAAQIAALTKQVEDMSKHFNNRSRSHSNSRHHWQPRSRSRSRNTKNKNNTNNSNKKYEQCWFHFKFNENAQKCTDWCKFNPDFQNKQKN